MLVTAKCQKVLYEGDDDYRVLSMRPLQSDGIVLSKYGTFSLVGNNLGDIHEGEGGYKLDIMLDSTNVKYPNTYMLVGVPNVEYDTDNGKIVIEERHEIPILRNFMSKQQAVNINNVYPHFCQDVMNGMTASDFDIKKIENVGKRRIVDYVYKLIERRNLVMMMPCLLNYGIVDTKAQIKLVQTYGNADRFMKQMSQDPYHVFINDIGYSFKKADAAILAVNPSLSNSLIRCVASCRYVCQQNETNGNTRIKANDMAYKVRELTPECYMLCKDAVMTDKFHYDNDRKLVSLIGTYNAECNVADNVLSRVNGEKNTPMKLHENNAVLTNEQLELLKLVADGEKIVMLVGNAGCGKSYTTNALIHLLESNDKSYQLLAPTGTASKVLSRYTGKKARTIHGYLLTWEDDIDYVIVDEASMIGVELLSCLFQQIGKNTSVVLVCDNAQLASISCGNVVTDLLHSGIVKTARLTRVFRYNTSGLATIATDIRRGEYGALHGQYPDFQFIPIDRNPIEQVCQAYEQLLQQYDKNDIMILSPYNKGNAGSNVINATIQDRYNGEPLQDIGYKLKEDEDVHEVQFKVGDIVLNTKNMTTEDTIGNLMYVSNGSRGEIVDIMVDGDFKEITVQFDDCKIRYDKDTIKQLKLGYAESCHKAQGGQSKAVIVVIDNSHARLLSRNLLYVAMTRSTEKLVLIGSEDAVKYGCSIEEQNQRDTWLYEKLTLDKV